MAYTHREDHAGVKKGGKRFGTGSAPWKRPFADTGRRSGGFPSMHSAVCGGCGNACEVPFRPNGKKPVFCATCFRNEGDGSVTRDKTRSFSRDTRPFRPSYAAGASDVSQDVLRKINDKLDAILDALAVRK